MARTAEDGRRRTPVRETESFPVTLREPSEVALENLHVVHLVQALIGSITTMRKA